MPAPSWSVGMQRIGPGLYVDPRTRRLHFDAPELCASMNFPATEENCAIATEAAWEAIRKHFPDIERVEVSR